MSTENLLIDAALRGWKSNVERVDKLFGTLSPEQLDQQVAPGKNRLIYLWGHLAAVNDGLFQPESLDLHYIQFRHHVKRENLKQPLEIGTLT